MSRASSAFLSITETRDTPVRKALTVCMREDLNSVLRIHTELTPLQLWEDRRLRQETPWEGAGQLVGCVQQKTTRWR